MTAYTCDSCDEEIQGARVLVTTDATDARGVNVVVSKRWHLCQPCAERIADRIGEPSPWQGGDAKTIVLPDDDTITQHLGGYGGTRR